MNQASDAPSIVPTLEPVGRLIREGVLAVPPYQRSYAWGERQIETFWFDLRASLVGGDPLYFLGTVVISGGVTERAVVIDGQQRLATTTMLFGAIRDVFKVRNDVARANTIQERYLEWSSLESTGLEARLSLNEQDRPFFENVVIAGNNVPAATEAEPESVGRMRSAFLQLATYLRDDVESAGPRWQDRLLAWVGFLDRHARVIVVRVRDDADAFLIFETLNARGLELSAADLIKNYLFGLSRNEIEAAQEQWAHLARSIEASASSTEITTFVRHWWASRYGAVRERDLYRKLKLNVQSHDQARDTLSALSMSAPFYSAILNADHEFWADQREESAAAAAILLELGLEQYRPLLLTGLENFSKFESERLVIGLLNWSVRGLIVGGIGGGTTERYYAEAAVRISNGRISTTDEVLSELEPVIASDDDFANIFATRRVIRTRQIHYYLRALKERQAIPLQDARETAVVPILPRTDPHGLWSNYVDPEVLGTSSTRLGNFVLISKAAAAYVPSVPSERIAYLSSEDQILGVLESEWTIEKIAERQTSLAGIAPGTWARRTP